MTKVFIDGAEGTTGLQIRQRLARHPLVELIEIDPDRRKDLSARRERLNSADIAILCLPDAAAVEAAAMVSNPGTRVIDASTAHRVDPGWAYGLPEVFGDAGYTRVRSAARVSVPGCYPSGFLLLIRPLSDAGIISPDFPAACFAVSGYTGGGKALIAEYTDPGRSDVLSGSLPYGLTLAHKHVPEMHRHSGLDNPPIFTPILGDYAQGMVVSVPIHASQMAYKIPGDELRSVFTEHYCNRPFIHVAEAPLDLLYSGRLDPQARNNTNHADIFVFSNGDRHLLCARYDNLGKGASGAAVQCLNLMIGADETTGGDIT